MVLLVSFVWFPHPFIYFHSCTSFRLSSEDCKQRCVPWHVFVSFLSKILLCSAGLLLYLMSFPSDLCFPAFYLSLKLETSLCFISSRFFLKSPSLLPASPIHSVIFIILIQENVTISIIFPLTFMPSP